MGRSKIIIPKEKLEELYLKKRLSLDFITKKLNCSERTIFDRLHEYSVPIRNNRERNDITKERLEDLYANQKMSIGGIAHVLKCGKNTIWSKLQKYSINIRNRSEAHIGKYKINLPANIKHLYLSEGLSVKKISQLFQCSSAVILKRLRDYGVSIRSEKIYLPIEKLRNLYIVEKLTIYQIGGIFKCDGVTILNRLKQYGIPVRRKGESNMEKYKVDMPIEKISKLYSEKKVPISEIKKVFKFHANTLRKRLERSGVHIRTISEALKGNPSPMRGKHHTEETKKKLSILTTRQLASGSMRRKDTSIEIKLEVELRRNSINFQKNISLCDITVPDFYLPDFKLAIYADGDYWHKLPAVKSRDEKQVKVLQENGYRILRFWEHEVNESITKCMSKIKDYIKV